MKKIALLLIIFCGNHIGFSQSMKDFSWLKGKWERHNVKPGTSVFEVWEKTKNGYFGQGVSLKGVDTTFVEKLSLIEKEGNLYYVADVAHNPEPTYFKITSYTKNGFVSENPQHDFPKKIEYILEGERMTVVISDGDKKMGFVFVKMK